jgi:hypothetical protein
VWDFDLLAHEITIKRWNRDGAFVSRIHDITAFWVLDGSPFSS